MLFHPLDAPLPTDTQLNDPFNYRPDPLCLLAAAQMQQLLPPHPAEGKMMGVLIVEKDGRVGYLQAFSGQTDWPLPEDEFIPPVFDYLLPNGYFKRQEAEIVRINQRIEALMHSPDYLLLCQQREETRQEFAQLIAQKQAAATLAKTLRDQRRLSAHLSEEEKKAMVRESQFLKAEIRRVKARQQEAMARAEARLMYHERELAHLRSNRKLMSEQLQEWLFTQFRMRNGRGETKDLLAIFDQWHTLHLSPKAQRRVERCPSGAGECCEPKLLQYALTHAMHPLRMAMFWWGPSPKDEVRHHGQYYPACQRRCRPILSWMLQGLNAKETPFATLSTCNVRVLYEDETLAVIEKPSGLLSVPGKDDHAPSVISLLAKRWQGGEGPYSVHRLDCDTSGLMVVARTAAAQAALQAQFAQRTTHKEYTALCQYRSGLDAGSTGEINLPLAPDYDDRPRMRVDHKHGKEAHSHYLVLRTLTLDDGSKVALLRLTPTTGRTHQLRVHCAHAEGLAAPIIGDTLYGLPAHRLCLHASLLEFDHPTLHRRMRFHSDPPFLPL